MKRKFPGKVPWAGLVFGAGLAARLFVSFRTALPSVDGVIFLRMSRDMAAGEWARALERVFHPLYPLLCSPLVLLGLEPFTAARILLSLCGAAGAALVLPLSTALGASRRAALALSLLAAFSPWACRYAGDAYSEPLFSLLAALAALLYLRQREDPAARRATAFLAGAAAGLAFSTRPEGAALAGAFLLAGPGRIPLSLGALLPASAYLGARFLLLGVLGPTPKLGFMLPMGPLGRESLPAGILLYLENLGKALLLGFEALGPLGWSLALLGILSFLFRRKSSSAGAGPILLALLFAWTAMAAFQVKRRFLVDWAPILYSFGALGWDLLAPRGKKVLPFLLAAALVSDLARLYPPRKFDKIGEVVLARWLKSRLGPGERIVTDLPRVAYYAGFPPPPPRVPTPADLAGEGADPRVRFLVLGSRRELLRRFGPPPPWRPARLPQDVARAAEDRGIAVFTRPGR